MGVLVAALAFADYALTLGPRFPATHALWGDWANLSASAWTFFAGYLFGHNPRLLDTAQRVWRWFVLAGLLTFVALYTRPVTGTAREVVGVWNGLFWILGLTGLARAKLSFSDAFLRYATLAVYPYYILHQTVTVGIMFGIVGWMWPWWDKWFVAAAGAFLVTWLLYEVLIRRVRWL